MSVTTHMPGALVAPAGPSHGHALTEAWWVAQRLLRLLSRTPSMIFFSLMMPLIWLGMFSQTFAAVFARGAAGPGGAPLPYDFVAVMLPSVLAMTAMQSASQSGFGLVMDLDSGFMDKLLVAPIRRSSVLVGKLLADGLRLVAQAALVLLVAYLLTLIAGWRIPFAAGLPGAFVIVLLAAGFGVAFSGLSNTLALRTRSTEVTMTVSFSLTFPLLFLSTGMLPAQLLPGWVQQFSAVNPVSYFADAVRAMILTGFDWTAIGEAALAIGLLGVILNGLSVAAYRALGR